MRTITAGALLALLCLSPAAFGADADKDNKPDGKTYEIPYKFTLAKHIVVRAKINGKGPFNFVLDTGAPALFVAVPIAKKAKVSADEDGWADLDKFEIEGGLVIKKARARIETPFQLEGMNGMGLAGLEIHGMLGYNILAKYRMTFDFTQDKLVFTELNYKPSEPFKLRGKGTGMGGLEMMGKMMKMLGGLLKRKATPDVTLRGFFGMTLAEGDGTPVVVSVLDKGPAGKAGLKKGDRIKAIDGDDVENLADAMRRTAKATAGAELKLTVKRGGESKDIIIKIGEGI